MNLVNRAFACIAVCFRGAWASVLGVQLCNYIFLLGGLTDNYIVFLIFA